MYNNKKKKQEKKKKKHNPKQPEQVWCAGAGFLLQDPGALSRPPEGAESALAENPLAKCLRAPHCTERLKSKTHQQSRNLCAALTARIHLVRNPERSESGQDQHHMYPVSHLSTPQPPSLLPAGPPALGWDPTRSAIQGAKRERSAS